MVYLDFEKPVAALEARILELQDAARHSDVDVGAEIAKLRGKADKQLKDTYANLTAWQKTQVARHPERPHFKHYIEAMFTDFMPLAGDRAFGDDQAIIGGLGRLNGRRVMVIGHEKGDDTQSRLRHNFGMGKPEGYRKAIRLMELADRFGIPVVSLVDTSGAFPGIQAEERGQAEAIARSTEQCLALGVPMIACIVGEGGSVRSVGFGRRVAARQLGLKSFYARAHQRRRNAQCPGCGHGGHHGFGAGSRAGPAGELHHLLGRTRALQQLGRAAIQTNGATARLQVGQQRGRLRIHGVKNGLAVAQ
jgi:acetyl-CoA carboxylase carboxyl transferase alpha subunit